MQQRQQGDVVFETVDSAPEGAQPLRRWQTEREFVLAEGEQTGHAHVMEVDAEDVGVEVLEKDGVMYLHLTRPALVSHPEHGPQSLGPGVWAVRQVRQVDHLQRLADGRKDQVAATVRE